MLEYSMIVKLQTEPHLEFLSLKGGCTGSSESTLVKMSNCWKSFISRIPSECQCLTDDRGVIVQKQTWEELVMNDQVIPQTLKTAFSGVGIELTRQNL